MSRHHVFKTLLLCSLIGIGACGSAHPGTTVPPGQGSDLTISRFNLTSRTQGGNFELCFLQASDGIDVHDIGPKDAGAYNITFGVAKSGDHQGYTHACNIPVPGGTRSHSTTTLSLLAMCCSTPLNLFEIGQAYVMFGEADLEMTLADPDRSNNRMERPL